MTNIYHYIDFEFRPSPHKNDLVCCCIQSIYPHHTAASSYWLNGAASDTYGEYSLLNFLRNKTKDSEETHIFVAFAAMAEMGCFLDLGLDPHDYNWLCLRTIALPYVYSSSQWALHFQDGWDIVKKEGDDDEDDGDKAVRRTANLVDYCSFFCGTNRDVDTKHGMVDLILSKSKYSDQEVKDILAYCWEDVVCLPELFHKMQQFISADISDLSGTLCHYVKVQRTGVPINYKLLETIKKNLPTIRQDVILECNKLFRDENFTEPFEYKQEWQEKYYNFVAFLDQSGLSKDWPRTDKGKLKNDRDTTRSYKHNKHVNALRSTKQLLTDLRMLSDHRSPGRRGFFDYVSSDTSCQHPYYNPFGSVTGRCQAPATSFIYAQPSWMRILIDPPEGMSIVSMDFVSQEVWIAAAQSGDGNLMEDYLSGDVYMSFGKASGLIPEDGDKTTHGKERNICKGVILGLQFGMGVAKLAAQVGTDDETARVYVNRHKSRYWKFWQWRKSYIEAHERTGHSELPNGWYLKDNRAYKANKWMERGEHYALTTGNFPIQGMGSCILYRTVSSLAMGLTAFSSFGVNIISTVHDEINILCPEKIIQEIISLMRTHVNLECTYLFPFEPRCRVDFTVQNHGELLIKDKGKEALKRLSPYLGLPQLEELLK